MRRRQAGFTLVELLISVAIIGVLASMLVPAVFDAVKVAQMTACSSNLRQLGLAVRMYLNDNDGLLFPIRGPNDPDTPEDEARLWYFGYETGTQWGTTAEGQRVLDKSRAKLYPYVGDYDRVEICPAFAYYGSYKAKFRGKWWTYGINRVLAPDRLLRPGDPCRSLLEIRGSDTSRTVVLADAAQINTFQAPASPGNPLIEEWHYVQPMDSRLPDYPHVHFRHMGRANVLFADWHVEACEPAAGTIDPRVPEAMIGHLDPEKFLYRPRGDR